LPAGTNHLIELLPGRSRTRLLGIGEEVDFAVGEILGEVGTRTQHVYFPTAGFVSLVAAVNGRPTLEVGMVGREGMLGTQLVLGMETTPLHAVVQGAGTAWRVGGPEFARELARSSAMHVELNKYVYVTMMQLASAASCLRFHEIRPRLARWLLMTQDRARSDSFQITQEFLAYMLGVRRVGITTAACALQRDGLIRYRRGNIRVLSRSGLKAAACGCYAADREAYLKVLGRAA
jgi:CRP-like cAMP-binding protein